MLSVVGVRGAPSVNAAARQAIFAANRATGHIALGVAASARPSRSAPACTRTARCACASRMRAADALEAVIVNTGGGMTGGDRFAIDIALAEGASLVAGTAAAEKIYRSTGPDTEMDVNLTVGANAKLVWLPQETILFDRARLSRRIEIDLADTATLLMAEAVVFGRAAMGEAMAQGLFADRWRLRRGGKLVFADSARLDGGIAAKLAAPACAAGGIAIATVLIAPGDDAKTWPPCARSSRAVRRRGRHLGLERHRGGAALRQGRRGAAPRSDLDAGRAQDARAAAWLHA